MDNKTRRFWIRLTPEEDALFKEKASNYHTISAMVRDAVRQFNDIGTMRKIEALTELAALYRKYQQDLAWLGGNFNQAMKRANELAICGELSQDYFEEVIIPQLTHLLDFLEKVYGGNINFLSISDMTASGKCAISKIETAVSQAILGFTLSKEINIDFLYRKRKRLDTLIDVEKVNILRDMFIKSWRVK